MRLAARACSAARFLIHETIRLIQKIRLAPRRHQSDQNLKPSKKNLTLLLAPLAVGARLFLALSGWGRHPYWPDAIGQKLTQFNELEPLLHEDFPARILSTAKRILAKLLHQRST